MARFEAHERERWGHTVVCVVIVCAALATAYLFFRQSESVGGLTHRSVFEDAKRTLFAKLNPQYSTESSTDVPAVRTQEAGSSSWIDMDAKSGGSEGLWKWDEETSDVAVKPPQDLKPSQDVAAVSDEMAGKTVNSDTADSRAVIESASTDAPPHLAERLDTGLSNDDSVSHVGLSARGSIDDFGSAIRTVEPSDAAPNGIAVSGMEKGVVVQGGATENVTSDGSDAPKESEALAAMDAIPGTKPRPDDSLAARSLPESSQEPIRTMSTPPALLSMAPQYPVKDLAASLTRDEIDKAAAIGTTSKDSTVTTVNHTTSFGNGVRESGTNLEKSPTSENSTIWNSGNDATAPHSAGTNDVNRVAYPSGSTVNSSTGSTVDSTVNTTPAVASNGSPWKVSEDPLPPSATRTENGVQFSSVKTGVNAYNSERVATEHTETELFGQTTVANRSAACRVCDGDTLESIAKRFGGALSAELLYQWNQDRIADPELLPIGLELRLASPH